MSRQVDDNSCLTDSEMLDPYEAFHEKYPGQEPWLSDDEQEEQERDRVNSPDYYAVGPQTHQYGYYITVDEDCPFTLSKPIADEWFVCPAEEVEEFETHRAKAFHCIQWAKKFQAL